MIDITIHSEESEICTFLKQLRVATKRCACAGTVSTSYSLLCIDSLLVHAVFNYIATLLQAPSDVTLTSGPGLTGHAATMRPTDSSLVD